MTGFLTYGNRKFSHLDAQMRKLLPPLYQASKDLLPFVDADAAAFHDYMVCVVSEVTMKAFKRPLIFFHAVWLAKFKLLPERGSNGGGGGGGGGCKNLINDEILSRYIFREWVHVYSSLLTCYSRFVVNLGINTR